MRYTQTGQPYYGNEVSLPLPTTVGKQRLAYLNFTYQRFAETDDQNNILVFAYDVTKLVQARKALKALPSAALGA